MIDPIAEFRVLAPEIETGEVGIKAVLWALKKCTELVLGKDEATAGSCGGKVVPLKRIRPCGSQCR